MVNPPAATTPTIRVAANVTAAMESQGIAVRTLAERTGIARMTLSRRLTGHSDFTIGELDAVARVLGVTVTSLLSEDVA